MTEKTNYSLAGVREHGEGYGVELVREPTAHGRLSIRARNEGGNNDTLVDFWDLIDWLQRGPESGRADDGFYLPTDERPMRTEG